MLNFVVTTYDAYNRLATETDARGNIKTHAYEHARGLHLGTTYTVVDGTAETSARSFTYNHLGLLTQLMDDSGVRTFTYNTYGERVSDSLVVDGDTHLITETRDSFGRSTGYTYAKNGAVQQTVSTGYGDDGRIASAGFLHGGAAKNFGYTYLAGTNLLQVLTKPNGMTLTQTYEATRDLLTGMAYHRGSTLVAQRTYNYDVLGRPTTRNTARQGSVMNDAFAHNTRSELVSAQVNGTEYEYAYDNIGNRQQATEGNEVTVYDANALNQYIAISENGAPAFEPQFDADGNQTRIKTETGIWSAVYNAENRPVTFTNSESNTIVECQYDSMGRRAYKKVTVNGEVTLHQRYIYRDYLQIAALDLTRSHHPCLYLLREMPFMVRSINTDNGSEFINYHLQRLLKEKYKRCKLTRSRPYKKNDNARAEERNRHKVRELIGYERIDNEQCVFLLNQVYRYHNLLTNFFVASTRLVSKQRNPVTGKTRKKYDKARTPYERVMEQMKDGARKRNLVALREALDPIELQENIQKSLKRLFLLMKPESIL